MKRRFLTKYRSTLEVVLLYRDHGTNNLESHFCCKTVYSKGTLVKH